MKYSWLRDPHRENEIERELEEKRALDAQDVLDDGENALLYFV